MSDIAERLDAALAGRPGMGTDLIPLLNAVDALAPLRHVPPRTAASEQRGLQSFLAQAAELRPTVSARPAPRHTGWRLNFRKETSPMNALITLSLILALALGGTGATAYAAQDSLPTEPLYAVKLITEDARLGLASGPQAQLNLLLEMAQVRTNEMTALTAKGEPIPESVPVRLQTHLEAALQIAAQFGEPEMAAALEQIRAAAETQTQAMTQAQHGAPDDAGLQLAQRALTQTREMAELGLADPALFRERVNENRPETAPTQPELTPGAGDRNGNGAGPNASATPESEQNRNHDGAGGPDDDESGNGPGYRASGTPPPAHTPQSGVSNGPGPNPSATPQYDQNRNGPGDPVTGTPADNGNDYSPGPKATGTCTPEYDGNSYGPGPGNPSVTPQGDNDSNGSGPQPTPQPDDSGNGHRP